MAEAAEPRERKPRAFKGELDEWHDWSYVFSEYIAGTDYGALLIATFRKPEAVVFKGQQTSKLSAWVCADCGFLEFYADDPKRLRV
ncbi:MAG: hypothetical protein EOP83_19460 [Verrucomicrobiaceae bacterium]|nr:MAG: hypothetical protein EOP83_19460 [Verrucomicrobiaceae bacterium]